MNFIKITAAGIVAFTIGENIATPHVEVQGEQQRRIAAIEREHQDHDHNEPNRDPLPYVQVAAVSTSSSSSISAPPSHWNRY